SGTADVPWRDSGGARPPHAADDQPYEKHNEPDRDQVAEPDEHGDYHVEEPGPRVLQAAREARGVDGARGVSLDGRGRVRRREVDGDRGLRGLGRQQSDLALELFDVELDWGQRVLEPQRVLDARRVREQLE